VVGCGSGGGEDLPSDEELTAVFTKNAEQVYEDEASIAKRTFRGESTASRTQISRTPTG
jgi:hypothetical protein